MSLERNEDAMMARYGTIASLLLCLDFNERDRTELADIARNKLNTLIANDSRWKNFQGDLVPGIVYKTIEESGRKVPYKKFYECAETTPERMRDFWEYDEEVRGKLV